MMERVKVNDPVAMREISKKFYNEDEDYERAFEYWKKAAELGDAGAHFDVAGMYHLGRGVEEDQEKKIYHCEKAAIGGHPAARNSLGNYEERNGNNERAVKHFIIAANIGHEKSMKALWKHYSDGNIAKQDLEATLRAHQAAIDEMKSPERDAAEADVAFLETLFRKTSTKRT
jgi:TPR repeat protein